MTHAELLAVLHYDSATGIFTWIVQRNGKGVLGQRAGCLRKEKGRWFIGVFGRVYRASRLAWFYMTGSWPEKDVDHKDTNKENDAWDNLRDVTKLVNNQNNTRPRKHNKSTGVLGVRKTPSGTFVANIQANKERMRLGTFQTLKDASDAYLLAKAKHHPESTQPRQRKTFKE